MFTKNIAAPNKTKIFASLVGLLLVLLMLMTGITPASATTTVIISPSTQIVSQGQSFTINISIEPDTAIAGAQFNLQFNSSIVNVNGVVEGELFKQNGANTLFNPGTIDNVAGVVTHVWGNILNTSGAPKNVSTSGTFAIINITASNTAAGPSPLALICKPPISVLVSDPGGNAVPISVINGTVKVNRAPEPSDTSPPLVTNPTATPATILLNDNSRPRAPGTNISQLNVTVTDDTEVDTVTIDLSPIGGSAEARMSKIPGTDIWSVTTTATAGINLTHNLIVTATDIYGNSNTSVSIQLTVLRRGDVFRDNVVDTKDAAYIARYLAGSEPEVPNLLLVGDVIGKNGDPIGDVVVDMKDAAYIARYEAGFEDVP